MKKSKEEIEQIILELIGILKEQPFQNTAHWTQQKMDKDNHAIEISIKKLLYLVDEVKEKEVKVTGETSDGYHTFNELYDFRKVFNAALFNEWYKQMKYQVHKSKKHSDGEFCFGGGWFIVMATTPAGQISNHYELKDWDLFQCEERGVADKWDGHTAKDVLDRITSLQKGEEKE